MKTMQMGEGIVNFKMTRGDSESLTVTCEELPFTEGDRITFTMRKYQTDPEKVMEKIITEFDEGKAIIEFKPEDTKELRFRRFAYDIEMRRADGMVKTILKGELELDWEVTY